MQGENLCPAISGKSKGDHIIGGFILKLNGYISVNLAAEENSEIRLISKSEQDTLKQKRLRNIA